MSTAAGRVWGGMSASEREERRRVQFLDAGLETFACRGWDSATVQQICRQAGLSQRYFYELFSGREGLFLSVCAAIAERLEGDVRAVVATSELPPEERARNVLTAVIAFFSDDPRQVRVALVESFATPNLRAYRAELLTRFSDFAARLMTSLDPHSDRAALNLSSAVLAGGIAETLIAASIAGTELDQPALVEHLTSLYIAAARSS
ncbi:MAG: TetR/AcrR family transcriptional regulator [Solirubrobacteraceae bacterium]